MSTSDFENVDNNDVTAANDLCDKAHLLLVERNKKCKALK